MGQNPASFCLFCPFSQNNSKYSANLEYKSVNGVHGIRIRYCRMVGADKSTKLWRPTYKKIFLDLKIDP